MPLPQESQGRARPMQPVSSQEWRARRQKDEVIEDALLAAPTAVSVGPYGEEAKDFAYQAYDEPTVAPLPLGPERIVAPKSPWKKRQERESLAREADERRRADYERALEVMVDTLEGRVSREYLASSRIEMVDGERKPVDQLRTDDEIVAAYPQHMVFDDQRYEVVRELGEGGQGVVVEVRPQKSHATDVEVQPPKGVRIVKLVSARDVGKEGGVVRRKFVRRLLVNEIDANDYEGIYVAGKMYENERGEQVYALLLEKGTGETLSRIMQENPERFETPEGRAVLLRAAAAVVGQLRAMERRGWTHHDIKPSNILIDWEHPERSRLIDHGLSAQRGLRREGREGVILGPGETAPFDMRTMLFQPRESIAEEDQDLRTRDMYGLALSVGMAMGVFQRRRDIEAIAEISRAADEPADRFVAARLLGDVEARDEHLRELGWLRPEREAIALVYDVVRPHDSAVERLRYWRDHGVEPDAVGRRLEALASEAEHVRAAMLVVEASHSGVLGEDVPVWRVRRMEEVLRRFDGARDEDVASRAYMELVEALEEIGVGDLFAQHHAAMQNVVRESREAEARAVRRRSREKIRQEERVEGGTLNADAVVPSAAHVMRRRLNRVA